MSISFKFWQDEEMTIPLMALSFSTILGQNKKKTGVFYFGSPLDTVKLQTVENSGFSNIVLKPFFRLPEIKRNTDYAIESCNDFILNGFIYRLIKSGKTAESAPAYYQTIGDIVIDGTAQFKCVSKAHSTSELKLSFSEDGLNTAIAGGVLSLGNTINGGTSIAIYYSLENSIDNVFNDLNCPQLCIEINDCVETEI